jgi:hypothetical protein
MRLGRSCVIARLTDGNITDVDSGDRDQANRQDANSSSDGFGADRRAREESSVLVKNVLPTALVNSLYLKAQVAEQGLEGISRNSTIKDLHARLDEQGSAMDDVSVQSRIDWECVKEESVKDLLKTMDLVISRIETSNLGVASRTVVRPDLSPQPGAGRTNREMGSGMIARVVQTSKLQVEHDKTIPLKLSNNTKLKGGLNLNINVNVQVMKESNRGSTPTPAGKSALSKIGNLTPAPTSSYSQVGTKKAIGVSGVLDSKRKTSESIKVINEIRDKFKKKLQAAEAKATINPSGRVTEVSRDKSPSHVLHTVSGAPIQYDKLFKLIEKNKEKTAAVSLERRKLSPARPDSRSKDLSAKKQTQGGTADSKGRPTPQKETDKQRDQPLLLKMKPALGGRKTVAQTGEMLNLRRKKLSLQNQHAPNSARTDKTGNEIQRLTLNINSSAAGISTVNPLTHSKATKSSIQELYPKSNEKVRAIMDKFAGGSCSTRTLMVRPETETKLAVTPFGNCRGRLSDQYQPSAPNSARAAPTTNVQKLLTQPRTRASLHSDLLSQNKDQIHSISGLNIRLGSFTDRPTHHTMASTSKNLLPASSIQNNLIQSSKFAKQLTQELKNNIQAKTASIHKAINIVQRENSESPVPIDRHNRPPIPPATQHVARQSGVDFKPLLNLKPSQQQKRTPEPKKSTQVQPAVAAPSLLLPKGGKNTPIARDQQKKEIKAILVGLNSLRDKTGGGSDSKTKDRATSSSIGPKK